MEINLTSPLKFPKWLGFATAATCIGAAIAGSTLHAATTIFSDNFERSALAPYNYAGKGNVWATYGTSAGSIGIVDSEYLEVNQTSTDPGGAFAARADLQIAADFDTSQAGQGTMKLTFDLDISSYQNNTINTISVGYYNEASLTNLFLNFGAIDIEGTQHNALFLSPGRDSFQATESQIIGYDAGTNEWASGFDFGVYDNSTYSNNGTGSLNVELIYDTLNGVGSIVVTTAGGDVATKSINLENSGPWSNLTNKASLRYYGPENGGTGSYTVDNINLTAIPEPGQIGMVLGMTSILILSLRRKQRHQK
ncbi:hypothetical protein [Puniceicoccus vermicola]|uniref:PEP-CTERM sorting domain-containing protein n=1 Tax=Puniceicoccus vermicola TaxID=388746 RepID=A0A7X1B1D7_9BACT|nr:hypothetical protein [Puniceicoccus vermicola]MBC2602743.1 hypothetical protein [Puniceicoccus vermicola]